MKEIIAHETLVRTAFRYFGFELTRTPPSSPDLHYAAMGGCRKAVWDQPNH